MNIEIHVYHHILTSADVIAKLEAEIARLKAEAPTPTDMGNLDAIASKARDFRPSGPAILPVPLGSAR